MIKTSKTLLCLVLIFILGMSGVIAVTAETPIAVAIDGQHLQFDVPPTIIDGRTMVPMRVIFEALGAEIYWNEATQTITATAQNLVITTSIGVTTIYVNGMRIGMDVAPIIIGGRTLVPVRFVSEAFGADVNWIGEHNLVMICSAPTVFQETHMFSDYYGQPVDLHDLLDEWHERFDDWFSEWHGQPTGEEN
ncbi:MAG: copper amine oxidase N-terminal domain-containing protein [Defluviitaleaceae bacterium]|nr:copper amine oxidase N-terminal domain-containing protein [Defluviitaleaceae bacterium]